MRSKAPPIHENNGKLSLSLMKIEISYMHGCSEQILKFNIATDLVYICMIQMS